MAADGLVAVADVFGFDPIRIDLDNARVDVLLPDEEIIERWSRLAKGFGAARAERLAPAIVLGTQALID
jgi:hypothetical protein